jgi:hypothetical protein
VVAPVDGREGDDLSAIDEPSVGIDGEHAIGITVEREPRVGAARRGAAGALAERRTTARGNHVRGDVGVGGRDEELKVRHVGVDSRQRDQKLRDRRPVVRQNNDGVWPRVMAGSALSGSTDDIGIDGGVGM